MTRSIIILAVAGLLAAGCPQRSNEESPQPEEPASRDSGAAEGAETPSAGDAAAEGSEGDAGPSAEEVPVAEDFEEEAEGAITADNYRAELDRLATEIEGEGEGGD